MLICNLNSLMLERNIDIKKLSNLSGIKLNTLKKYSENKVHIIHFKTLNKLCKILKCNTADLFIEM